MPKLAKTQKDLRTNRKEDDHKMRGTTREDSIDAEDPVGVEDPVTDAAVLALHGDRHNEFLCSDAMRCVVEALLLCFNYCVNGWTPHFNDVRLISAHSIHFVSLRRFSRRERKAAACHPRLMQSLELRVIV
jgi:hypothetical protein